MPYYWAYDSRRCRFGPMLTPEQRTEFDERGFVLIPSAFTAAEASAMEDLVWAHVEAREGVIRGDPSTWNLTMVVGLGHLKAAPAFAAIGSPVTVAALDDVLGEGRWVRPKNWGQLLVTFPTPDVEWTVPSDVCTPTSTTSFPRARLPARWSSPSSQTSGPVPGARS